MCLGLQRPSTKPHNLFDVSRTRLLSWLHRTLDRSWMRHERQWHPPFNDNIAVHDIIILIIRLITYIHRHTYIGVISQPLAISLISLISSRSAPLAHSHSLTPIHQLKPIFQFSIFPLSALSPFVCPLAPLSTGYYGHNMITFTLLFRLYRL